tara:strand:- start:7019 stop:8056 length:1038 start_codon:yes stop_codon:yes gene_type:complete
MKVIKITFTVLFILAITYFAGPRASFEPIASTEIRLLEGVTIQNLDNYLARKESAIDNIRADNQAKIIWADSSRTKTSYAVVYLHGFSASHEEGSPVHKDFANRYGFNLYLARLANHGLAGEESMTDMTPNGLIESAKEAVAIGQLLGDDVIVMSTSTGGTLSIYLAGANPEMIDALVLFSPNIEIADPSARILTGPWGLQLGKMIAGEFRASDDPTPLEDQFWTSKYRIEAIAALQKLLDETMNEEVFSAVTQPYFLGYYYKNETEKDDVVSIDAIKRFSRFTSTPEQQIRVVEFPNVGEHVIASYIKSKDLESVKGAVFQFAEDVLQLKPQPRFVDTLVTDTL